MYWKNGFERHKSQYITTSNGIVPDLRLISWPDLTGRRRLLYRHRMGEAKWGGVEWVTGQGCRRGKKEKYRLKEFVPFLLSLHCCRFFSNPMFGQRERLDRGQEWGNGFCIYPHGFNIIGHCGMISENSAFWERVKWRLKIPQKWKIY